MNTITHPGTAARDVTDEPPAPAWVRPARWVRWSAFGAASWAVAFAAVNVYLQLGGVDGDNPLREVWSAMTVMNLSVIALKAAGAALALAAVSQWGRRLPTWLVTAGMWGAGGLLLLYAGVNAGALIADGALTSALPLVGGEFAVPGWSYAAFFAVPGVLFAAVARDHQRRSGTASRWMLLGLLGAPALLAMVLLGLPWLLTVTGLLPG
jgi:hypothetical protein